MKKIAIFFIISLFSIVIGVQFSGWLKVEKLKHCDSEAVLTAGREIIINSSKYRKYSTNQNGKNIYPVFLESYNEPPFLPSALKSLDYKYIGIYKDRVLICFSVMPRIYINIFDENAEEFGSEKIIDGLWLKVGS